MSLEWLEWWSAERLVAAAAVGQLGVSSLPRGTPGIRLPRRGSSGRSRRGRSWWWTSSRTRVPFVNLVIANLGRTMARNVRIEADPPFDPSVYRPGPVQLAWFTMFNEGIPALAPGKRIVLLFDQMHDRDKLGLPDTYRVRLTYEWDGGDPLSDELRLDLELYRPLRRIAPRTVHDVSKTLDAIHRQFEKWTAGVDSGLLVLSPEDRRRRNDEIMAEMEERRAAERAAGNGRAGLAGRLLEVAGRLRRG